MKTIKNAKSARCIDCFLSSAAVLVDGDVVCNNCGSSQLIDPQGHIFDPVFIDDPAKTYRASKYTPALPDRRKASRVMPISKERRNGMFV